MPSAFAGQSGEDTIGSALSVNAGVNGQIALGVNKKVKGLGFLAQGAWARSVSETTSAGVTGFSLQAMLYVGEARLFTHKNVKYHLKVSVRHEKNVSPGVSDFLGEVGMGTLAGVARKVEGGVDWLSEGVSSAVGTATRGVLKGAVRAFPPSYMTGVGAAIEASDAEAAAIRAWEAQLAAAPDSATRESTVDGSVQFILHEKLARPAELDDAALAEVGRTEVLARFSSKQATASGHKAKDVVVPPFGPYLAADGRVDPDADAQVMEVLSSKLGDHVKEVLKELGIDDNTFSDRPWDLTEPMHLEGAAGAVRPGSIRHVLVKKGLWKDKHVTIELEGAATNASEPNLEAAKLFQMHVSEGGPILASGQSKTKLKGFNVGLPGMSWLVGGKKFSDQPGVTYGHGWNKTSSTTTNLTETTGRLAQGTRTYVETTADMLWRITVKVRDKNMAHKSRVKYAGRIVKVRNGLSFLRLQQPAVDPRGPGQRPKDPSVIRAMGRRPDDHRQARRDAPPSKAGPWQGARLVRYVRATNRADDDRMVPLIPLPASSVTDRLYPVTQTSLLDEDPAGGAAKESNPVLDAVLALLREHAPDLLESHWTVEGTSSTEGKARLTGTASTQGNAGQKQVPARLANVLNLQSLGMMIDTVLSSGLVLTTIRQFPGGSEQVRIVVEGLRDPHNRGYHYLESITGNAVRYSTRLGIENKAWSTARSGGFGSGAATTGSPAVANAAVAPGGPGGGTAGPALKTFREGGANPEGGVTQATTTGGYDQKMAAQRDTFFIPGPETRPHHRFSGDLQLKVSLIKNKEVSRAVNSVLMGAAQPLASVVQDSANTRRELPTKIVPLKERILVSHALIHHETVPEGPPGDVAAVQELNPAAPLGPALNITPENLLTRSVLSLGFDHEKLKILREEVAAGLTGTDPTVSGERSHAVARLIETGRSQELLRYILSYPLVTRELPNLLRPGGMKMPGMNRPGGPLTDTLGNVDLHVQFEENPDILGYVSAWVEAGGYDFQEDQQNQALQAGWSARRICRGQAQHRETG